MYDTLVFDLDGTLVHSAPDICAATNHALEPFGARTLSVDEIQSMIGNGLPKLLERAFAAIGMGPDQRQFDETCKALVACYEKHPAEFTTLYTGTREILEAFLGDGFRLCVCTNKLEVLALEVLDSLNIRQFFNSVIGGVNGQPGKPDPFPLIKAVTYAGGDPANAIMIGDSGVDAGVARAAGCPFVFVTFGYNSEPVSSMGAARVVDAMIDLPDAIHSLDRAGQGAA